MPDIEQIAAAREDMNYRRGSAASGFSAEARDAVRGQRLPPTGRAGSRGRHPHRRERPRSRAREGADNPDSRSGTTLTGGNRRRAARGQHAADQPRYQPAVTGAQHGASATGASPAEPSREGVPHSQLPVESVPTGWIDVASGASAFTV